MKRLLQRWVSPASADMAGYELISDPLGIEEIGPALSTLHEECVAHSSFLLVRLATTDARGLRVAFDRVQHLASTARTCLVIDVTTLDRIDGRLLCPRNVGLVLDNVDMATPLSAVIHDQIEAIRFGRSFVTAGSTNLRADAALRAILGLACDLGLGTLGPARGEEDAGGHLWTFDYVASATSPIDVTEALARSLRPGATFDRRVG